MPLDIPVSDTLGDIFKVLAAHNKRALVVGGSVRDALMGYAPKDIDIEVYGVSYDELASLLQEFGDTNLVGKKFGVIKLRDSEDNEFDFSIPRRDNKSGIGHRGFKTTFDPTITPAEAAARRDFTFNALAYDPLSQELHDYYGGVEDLRNGVLKATSPAFDEDPLRVLRGMQFAARFGMVLDPATAELCRKMVSDYAELRPAMIDAYVNGGREQMIADYLEERTLDMQEFQEQHPDTTPGELAKRFPDESQRKFPVDPELMYAKDIHASLALERISEEWMKLATKGKKPGSALGFLVDSGWIQFYPRLEQMIGVPQDAEWHPEGAVDNHVRHVMDAAAEIADRDGVEGDERAVLIFASLTHDLAKSMPEHGGTTMLRDKNGVMRWTSHGHEAAGGPMARELLSSMGIKSDIINKVVPLVEHHLSHVHFQGGASPKDVRKLAKDIYPASIRDLVRLIEADHSGRPPLPKNTPEQATKMLEMAQADGIDTKMLAGKDLISGKDIADRYYPARPQGKHIGDAQKAAYDAWLAGQINNPAEALDYVGSWLRTQPGLIKANDVQAHYPSAPQGKHIGDALKAARDAELSGSFQDAEGGKKWLAEYMANQTKPNP